MVRQAIHLSSEFAAPRRVRYAGPMTEHTIEQAYQTVYGALLDALKVSHDEQLALLAATDAAYAFLEAETPVLSDSQYLGLKVLLGEAETRLGRYFGM